VPASQVGEINDALGRLWSTRGKPEFAAQGTVFARDLGLDLRFPVDGTSDIPEQCTHRDRGYRDWYDYERRLNLNRHGIIPRCVLPVSCAQPDAPHENPRPPFGGQNKIIRNRELFMRIPGARASLSLVAEGHTTI
jgi:hypothetical protein